MRTQKISIDCLTGDPPESLEKLFGFTEQELMAHIVTGATNLLKKLNVLRADVEVIKFWFVRLLNGARVKKFGGFFRNRYTLRDKIQIVGKVKMLRKLASGV